MSKTDNPICPLCGQAVKVKNPDRGGYCTDWTKDPPATYHWECFSQASPPIRNGNELPQADGNADEAPGRK